MFLLQQVFYKEKTAREDNRKLQNIKDEGPNYYSSRGLKLEGQMNPEILANLEKAGIVKP